MARKISLKAIRSFIKLDSLQEKALSGDMHRCFACGRQAERGTLCDVHRSLPVEQKKILHEFFIMYGKTPSGNELHQYMWWRTTIKVYG